MNDNKQLVVIDSVAGAKLWNALHIFNSKLSFEDLIIFKQFFSYVLYLSAYFSFKPTTIKIIINIAV